jgi:hypothetical protein
MGSIRAVRYSSGRSLSKRWPLVPTGAAHFRPCCTHRDSPALLDLPFKAVNYRYLVLQTQNEIVVQSRCQTEREIADNSTTFSSFLNEIHYHDRRRHNL